MYSLKTKKGILNFYNDFFVWLDLAVSGLYKCVFSRKGLWRNGLIIVICLTAIVGPLDMYIEKCREVAEEDN